MGNLAQVWTEAKRSFYGGRRKVLGTIERNWGIKLKDGRIPD